MNEWPESDTASNESFEAVRDELVDVLQGELETVGRTEFVRQLRRPKTLVYLAAILISSAIAVTSGDIDLAMGIAVGVFLLIVFVLLPACTAYAMVRFGPWKGRAIGAGALIVLLVAFLAAATAREARDAAETEQTFDELRELSDAIDEARRDVRGGSGSVDVAG